MTDHEKEADQAKEGTQQEGRGEQEGVSSNVVLATGLGVLNLLDLDEEEKRWHEQREMDEAEARHDARKGGSYYRLDGGQPYVPKMPYPVPKDWDWRRVKREEEERRDKDGAEDRAKEDGEEKRPSTGLVEKEKEESERSSRADKPLKVWGMDPDKFDEDLLKYGEPGYECGY